jgi:hypothetical protein
MQGRAAASSSEASCSELLSARSRAYAPAVRDLGKPEVLKSAMLAGLATAIVCYPRLSTAQNLRYTTWYLEALLFLGGIVLWAFVFAWHTKYSGRPVFTVNIGLWPLVVATVSGIIAAAVLLRGDPTLRARTPADYPINFQQWVAMTLFSLAFTQLFLVFAPFAWLLRLFRRKETAWLMTVLFGLFVLGVKNRAPSVPVPPMLFLGLLVFRIIAGFLSVYFFLRGGVLLVWWWTLLLQSRHLFTL